MARRRRANTGPRPATSTGHYRNLINPYQPQTVISDDEVATIHETAISYLSEHGMRVLLDEARDYYAQGGSTLAEDDMVRLDPDRIREALRTAPSTFDVEAPNSARSISMGGRNLNLAPVGGPPFVSDRINGRRPGTLADQQNFLRLTQHYDVMSTISPSVEPDDIALNIRHLHSNVASLTLTDKVPWVFCRGRQRVRDSFDLIKIRFGIDTDDEFAERARCWTVVNMNSPRQLDIPMARGIIDFAKMGQMLIVTPFTLAGAMAPITLAGALVLQHMEALAGITLSQIVNPGAPVVYGAFTSNVDMKSGAPSFGTPEAQKAGIVSGQLARHIGLPWRSSGSSTSNTVDAQGGYETMMNMYGAVLGGANIVMHSAGWQEGGLTASYEKFILDAEMCQMIGEMCAPLVVDDATLALDAITDVGPGGHFFGTAHTLERFENAFYQPQVFSRANFEQWTEDGSLRADERATPIWQKILSEFEEPPIDGAIRTQLDDFVERRVSEGGAAPD